MQYPNQEGALDSPKSLLPGKDPVPGLAEYAPVKCGHQLCLERLDVWGRIADDPSRSEMIFGGRGRPPAPLMV